ncbi:MAG: chemotaxis response regulator protein-glutamate methylesterase [Isosphaeraceae bacterium]
MDTDRRIRVLIVDDSALIRKVIGGLLATSPRIDVVGTAPDGETAIALAESLQPDVITLDVEMPGISGLDAIPRILAKRPVPIVMVSTHTREGAEATLTALERGAVDFLPKPDRNQLGQMRAGGDLLVNKVLAAAQCKVARPTSIPAESPTFTPTSTPGPAGPRSVEVRSGASCVVIGISTGGPQTLTRVLQAVKTPLPPILVVQHMPAQFTSSLANRLNRLGTVAVKEAEDGDRILPDRVLIAPGDRHLTVIGRSSQARVALRDEPPVSGHKPSVDVLFEAAARVFGAGCVGLIMTGMGRDGVEGCRQILAAGGTTYGQDEASSIVYGMNKAAWEDGALRGQFPLEDLPRILMKLGS